MDFEPGKWLQIIQDHPVILVLFGGLVGGSAFTQVIKITYLAMVDPLHAVSVQRYRASSMWLAILATFFFTNRLWEFLIGQLHTGFRHVVAVIAAFAAPFVYKGLKALVATRWPNFAASWGDNGGKLKST